MNKILILLLVSLVLSACVPATLPPAPVKTTVSPTPIAEQSPWWQNTVFYEIFVRSFYDSNGDGIGDFNGLTQKLDYLNDGNPNTHTDLGITGIWLMPIHPSPSYHGYDVTNYYTVNPDYGTMDDFKRFLTEAHRRGIRVIIDLVLNHTSNQHPFFKDALSSPQSKYRDWYLFSDTDQGIGWYPLQGGGYYYGFFCDCMPDLNYRNPDVTAQMENVVRFWLNDVGVDGFRLDAINHLIEEGNKTENTPATHEWLKGFYTAYKADNPQAYTVGEVYGAGAALVKSYTGDQMDQAFNFEMASGFVNSAQGGSNPAVNSAMQFALHDMPSFDFATFLTNHDQNRVMSTLNGNVDKAKVAAALMLTSPGTPFIYYGEEIGMLGEKPDEDIRLPMQWSDAANAGFTTGQPWRPPEANYPQANVAAETENPDSLLSYYRMLIALRDEHSALRSNQIWLFNSTSPGVFASLRSDSKEKLIILVNLSSKPIQDYTLALSSSPLDGQYALTSLFGDGSLSTLSFNQDGSISNAKPMAELAPFTTYILELTSK